MANRPDSDAVWFERGGYGACRIAEDAVAAMTLAARGKAFLGYSDQGNLLGALYRDGFDHVAHGPMVADIRREGGDAAVARALDWLVARDPAACEGGLEHGARHAAFNLMTLSMMLGTPLVADYIRQGEIHKLKDVMKESTNLGMRTFDQSLFELYQAGEISYEDALRHADSANEVRLKIKLAQGGDAHTLSQGLDGVELVES